MVSTASVLNQSLRGGFWEGFKLSKIENWQKKSVVQNTATERPLYPTYKKELLLFLKEYTGNYMEKKCIKWLLSIKVLNLNKEMENSGEYLTPMFSRVSYNKKKVTD